METLLIPALNFSILCALLFYFSRKPTKVFVKNRHQNLLEEVQQVRDLLGKAQARNEELTAKLKAIDAEISNLKTQSTEEAKAISERLVAEAKTNAQRIVTDASQARETLFSDLQNQLRVELGESVLARAEEVLKERLTGDDRSRIRQEFSKQVEGMR